MLLRLLPAAKEEVEQAFGGDRGRQTQDCRRDDRGSKHQAAPLALNRQLVTQRLLHPTQPHLLEALGTSSSDSP
jgi:hypothetical protein